MRSERPRPKQNSGRARLGRLDARVRIFLSVVTGLALSATIGPAVIGASPSPTGLSTGDTRSPGAPGFVGDPGLAIVIVLAIGVATVLATYAYVQLNTRRATR